MTLAALAMIPTLRQADWSLTALPRVDSKTKLGADARAVDPGFKTVHPGAYDGQFYWGVAVDPLATGQAHASFDKASYRYGHPLYGWLGWLFTAGWARAAPAALAAIGLVSMFVAAAIAATLGLRRGRSGWEGLFVALNFGLISAAAHDLAEPLAAALLLGALASLVGCRPLLAWICLALLPLAKESLLVVSVAVVAWELGQHRVRCSGRYATTAVPALLWWTYTRVHLGAWFTTGDSALGLPLVGWWHTLFGINVRQEHARSVAVGILVSMIIVIALAAVRAIRRRGPVDLSYVALAAIAACLAPNATLAFTTALRNTALLIVLIPFVIAAPQLPGTVRRSWPSHL
jgi:hypothetical protein